RGFCRCLIAACLGFSLVLGACGAGDGDVASEASTTSGVSTTADTSGLTEPEQTTTTEIGSTAPSSSADITGQQAIQAEPNQYQAPGPDPAPPVTTGPPPTSPPPTPSPVSVDISGFTFVAAVVRVRVGGTVTWTNRDTAQHSAKGTGFNTGLLSLGQSASVTFNTPGTYQYQCSPHSSIRGTVIVEP
ncbi:MAG: hypothetical protein JHC63_11565, partial [Acidimicrobiia bacterium]|nr:hypothetical protein [Acidimicrobiia bacterium]